MSVFAEEFMSVTIRALRNAVLDYFTPIWRLTLWLRGFIRIPLSLQENLLSSKVILNHQEKALWAILDLTERTKESTKSWLFEMRRLSSEIEGVRDDQKRHMPELLERLEERLGSLSRAHAELAVGRYLEVVNEMRQRGDTSNAAEVLQLLGSISERRHLHVQSYAWFNLGEVFFEQSEENRAEIYFSRVIQHGEYDELVAAAHSRLSLIRYSRHRFVEATSLAERAIEIYERVGNRESVYQAYIQLVSSLLAQGDTGRASEALQKATNSLARLQKLMVPEK